MSEPEKRSLTVTDGAIDKTEAQNKGAEKSIPQTSTAAETVARQETQVETYPGGLRLAFAFTGLVLCLLVGGLDVNIIATAVPAITNHFHTVEDIGWYSTAYRLSACSLQFTFGKLYQVYPTGTILVASQMVFFLGSVLCAAAVSSAMLVVGRAVTGIGIAGGAAGFFNLLMEISPPQQRPLLGGIFGAVETLSGIIAPVLGGLITQHLSWRWCFWINLPICGAGILAMAFFLPKKEKTSASERPRFKTLMRKIDLMATVLLIGCLTCLFIAFNWAGIKYSWRNARIIALLIVAGVLFICLIAHQILRKNVEDDEKLLPTRLLKNRNVIGGFIFAICLSAALAILEYYAPTYFQAVHGYTPTRSGYMMFPCLIATLIGFLVQGIGTARVGYYTPFMYISCLLLSIGSGLMTTWNPSTGLAKQILYFALAGLGAGIGFQGPQNAAQIALAKEDVPLGIAVVLFAQSFGPAALTTIAQMIFVNQLPAELHELLPDANTSEIENLGLTQIRDQFVGQQLEEITLAYSRALSQSWYLAVGLSTISVVGALLMQWISVKKNAGEDSGSENVDRSQDPEPSPASKSWA